MSSKMCSRSGKGFLGVLKLSSSGRKALSSGCNENVGTLRKSDGALIRKGAGAADFLLKATLARLDAREARLLLPSATHDGIDDARRGGGPGLGRSSYTTSLMGGTR
jgi:hypothetical protein